MKEYNVAVLGATGAVGQQMMKVLEERNFPVKRLLPLASARSAGKQLAFRGEALSIEEATEASFAGMDIVLGAVSNEMAKHFAPAIQDSGAGMCRWWCRRSTPRTPSSTMASLPIPTAPPSSPWWRWAVFAA